MKEENWWHGFGTGMAVVIFIVTIMILAKECHAEYIKVYDEVQVVDTHYIPIVHCDTTIRKKYAK